MPNVNKNGTITRKDDIWGILNKLQFYAWWAVEWYHQSLPTSDIDQQKKTVEHIVPAPPPTVCVGIKINSLPVGFWAIEFKKYTDVFEFLKIALRWENG